MVPIKEIYKDIYQIKVPLPRNPLREMNSYLIKGEKRHLLIDTGFNWPECKKAQLSAMDLLGVKWSDVDFFLTHVHGDHSGLVAALADKDASVYCSKIGLDFLNKSFEDNYWEKAKAFYINNGFPEEKLTEPIFTIEDSFAIGEVNYNFIKDGDKINVGEYSFICVSTPGHSPGHMCLYEPKQKLLVSGDHILDDITPNIAVHVNDRGNVLEDYLASLKITEQLKVDLVLPGHRSLIYDHKKRIREIQLHHKERLAETKNIVKDRKLQAYNVAELMRWNVGWDQLTKQQRTFALGEAIAHLDYLEQKGQVRFYQEGMKGFYTG